MGREYISLVPNPPSSLIAPVSGWAMLNIAVVGDTGGDWCGAENVWRRRWWWAAAAAGISAVGVAVGELDDEDGEAAPDDGDWATSDAAETDTLEENMLDMLACGPWPRERGRGILEVVPGLTLWVVPGNLLLRSCSRSR